MAPALGFVVRAVQGTTGVGMTPEQREVWRRVGGNSWHNMGRSSTMASSVAERQRLREDLDAEPWEVVPQFGEQDLQAKVVASDDDMEDGDEDDDDDDDSSKKEDAGVQESSDHLRVPGPIGGGLGVEDEFSGGHEGGSGGSFDESLLSPVKAAETIKALLKRIDVLETNATISAVDKMNIRGSTGWKARFEFAKPPKFAGAKTQDIREWLRIMESYCVGTGVVGDTLPVEPQCFLFGRDGPYLLVGTRVRVTSRERS